MSRLVFDPMPPETPRPLARVLDAVLRSIREVLEGGWRWNEQVGDVRTISFNTDDLPLYLDASNWKQPPTTVVLLKSLEVGANDGIFISGGSVTWTFSDNRLGLVAFDALSASTKYEVTIAVME